MDKHVYNPTTKVVCTLKDGKVLKAYVNERHLYRYGEVPENYKEELIHKETMFVDLCNIVHYVPYKTIFRKRPFLTASVFNKRVYADELESVVIYYSFQKIDVSHFSLDRICGFLSFSEYADFLYDKHIPIINNEGMM